MHNCKDSKIKVSKQLWDSMYATPLYITEFADSNNSSIHALFPIHVKMNLKDHSKEKYIVTQFLECSNGLECPQINMG